MKLMKILLLFAAVWYGANSLFAQTWTQTSATNNLWTCVASSVDGVNLVAGSQDYGIFLSTNSGATWHGVSNYVSGRWGPTTTGIYWTSVASSADGIRLAATGDEAVYTTSDSGSNWDISGAPYLLPWYAVASSADGSKLAAVIWEG